MPGNQPSSLERLLEGIHQQQKITNAMLHRQWQYEQDKEAAKTPGDWHGYVISLNNPNVVQVAPRNYKRNTISIYNLGPNTIFLSDKDFNANEITARYNSIGAGETIPAIGLTTGQNISLNSTGSVYGYALGFNANLATGGSVLQILEVDYTGFRTAPGSVVPPGQSGMEYQGKRPDRNFYDVARSLR
jgi:NADH:ubiquinone oxidoreductase subunit